jgi:hypothetical protein
VRVAAGVAVLVGCEEGFVLFWIFFITSVSDFEKHIGF